MNWCLRAAATVIKIRKKLSMSADFGNSFMCPLPAFANPFMIAPTALVKLPEIIKYFHMRSLK
jgi:hypothetical protein